MFTCSLVRDDDYKKLIVDSYLCLNKSVNNQNMGLVYSQINLSNPVRPELKPIATKCLADSGSTFLVIPQHIATQLQLEILETREATTADGSSHTVPYAGPVKVNFENRNFA